jgi:phenylalanyl-tRNA synthetase beta subunit
LGVIGILHPRVVKNFKWDHPVAVLELDIEKLETRFFSQ